MRFNFYDTVLVASALYPITWTEEVVCFSLEKPRFHIPVQWGQWKLCGSLHLRFIPWHIYFAAIHAPNGQKITLFRGSTPVFLGQLMSESGSCLLFPSPVYLPRKDRKIGWDPHPKRESYALAQLVSITQPHAEVIAFWELSRVCIIILWGGLLSSMNNTMIQ